MNFRSHQVAECDSDSDWETIDEFDEVDGVEIDEGNEQIVRGEVADEYVRAMTMSGGDTYSWTTTIDWPTIENDSTTTDDYSYAYTSDTSTTTTSSTNESSYDDEISISTNGSNIDWSSETAWSCTSTSSVITLKEKKKQPSSRGSSSVNESDTDFDIMNLPSLRTVRYSLNEGTSFDWRNAITERSITDDRSSASFVSTRAESAPPRYVFSDEDALDNDDDRECRVPALSPSWWQPIRRSRLGVSNNIHRYRPRSAKSRRTQKPDGHQRRGAAGGRWKDLYHLLVVRSAITPKSPPAELYETALDPEHSVFRWLQYSPDDADAFEKEEEEAREALEEEEFCDSKEEEREDEAEIDVQELAAPKQWKEEDWYR